MLNVIGSADGARADPGTNAGLGRMYVDCEPKAHAPGWPR